MGDGEFCSNLHLFMKFKPVYIVPFVSYAIFSIFSSVIEGLSVSILPIVIRVLLSTEENLEFIPVLKPIQSMLENFLITPDPFTNVRNLSMFVGAIFISKMIVNSLKKFSILYAQESITRDIRDHIFHNILRAETRALKDVRAGDIISRITNEINNVKLAIRDGLGAFLSEGLNLIVFVFIAITSAPILSFFAWGILIFAAFLGWLVSNLVKRRSLKALSTLGDITSYMSDILGGIKVIKSMNFIDRVLGDFKSLSDKLYKKYLKLEFSAAVAPILSETMVGIAASVMLLMAGYFIYKTGTVSPDAFIVFLASSLSTIRPLKLVFQSLAYMQTAKVSLDRLKELGDLPEEKWGTRNPFNWKVLELRNVVVRYGDKTVLRIPNLCIKKGERIVVIGKSGSGKTTFIEVLAGIIKPDEGEVLLDGISLYEYDINKWREIVGFVPQEPYIFEGGLRGNFDREPGDILAKLSISGIYDRRDINLKDKLSGGEKQRVSIARAVIKRPDILIMDEPTSALDRKSEELVKRLVDELPKGTTLILVAHKPSTVSWGNRVLVFKEGEIVCDGKHADLEKSCLEYRSLLASKSTTPP